MSAESNLVGENLALKELERTGVVAQNVESPTAESQLQQILDRASRERLTVLPLGGGTAMGVATLPEKVDIALDMTGLARVLELDSKNLTMTVQSGITVDAINERLASEERGFFLPLDPPLSHRATIGGVYCSNLSGPSRLLYGTLRDQALGVSAVDAGGRLLNLGGVTVKNVSGYDLTKFFMGSAGSLCIITRVSFRIYPLPEASSLCEVTMESERELQDLLSALRASVLIPTGLVVTDGVSDTTFRVLAGFEGNPEAVERQNRDLLKLGSTYGGQGEARMGREAMIQSLRAAVDPEDSDANTLTLKVSAPIVQGPPAYSAIRSASEEFGLAAKIALLAGNGVHYVYVTGGGDEALLSLLNRVKEIARRLGGHVVPVKGRRQILSLWGPKVDVTLQRHVLKPIKDKLDPKGVLLPLG